MSTRTKWLVDHLSYLSYLPHFTSAARRPSSCRRLSLCPLDRSMSRRRAADDNGLPGTLHGLKAIAGPPRHMLDALRLHPLCHRFIIARLGDRKSVVSGKSVPVSVDLGGRMVIENNTGTTP